MLPDIKVVDNDPAKYAVVQVPLEEIFADSNFNCRGEISALSVQELAQSIASRGLDYPITLQPFTLESNPKIKFRVVAGHRRFLAFELNASTNESVTHIPAYIRPDLDETAARLLNIRENIQRQELNIKQEANALKYFLKHKRDGRNLFTVQELADIFGQSRGWIQNRQCLLMLPDDIQDQAAAGLLNTIEIQKLSKIKNKDELYETVRGIKERKLRNEKGLIRTSPSIKKPSNVLKAQARKKGEAEELGEILYDVLGPGFHTRLIAWFAGNISTAALMQDLSDHCKENDIEFKMPSFITNAVFNIKPQGMSNATASHILAGQG